MAIGPVVTLGFGSFGSVNLVPTLGYGIGEILVPDVEGMEYKTGGERMHGLASGVRMHGKTGGERMHYRKEND